MEIFDVETQGQQTEKKKVQKAQVNFRAPEDIASWIKERSKATGQTQEDFLNAVVEEYMLRVREEEFPSRGVETAEFVSHLTALQRMFVSSLDLWQHTEERVREEFRLQLETKDRAIADYQEQVTALKEEKKALSEDAAKAKTLQAELDEVTEQARKAKNDSADRIAEKDRLISALDGEVLKYKAQAEGYDDLKADRDSLGERLREADSTIKDLQKDHQMEMERAGMAAQQAQKQAVEATKAAMQDQIKAINDRLHEAVVAQAAAQAEANSLREFKIANDRLHETVGEQKAKITMLEAMLEEQTRELKASRNVGADGQTAIEGV